MDSYARLTRHEAAAIERHLRAQLDSGETTFDFSATREIDSAGIAVLWRVACYAQSQAKEFKVTHLHPAVGRTLALFPAALTPPPPPSEPTGFAERLGERTAEVWGVAVQFFALAADVATFVLQALTRQKKNRRGSVGLEMAQMGSNATGVVGLIAFLVGVTVALQSAVQLRHFGASILVADLIGVAITRELGPLMAAIVVAGRSGAAIAAEVATMVITEEIDALKTMGINPVRYLIAPKLIAMMAMQPLLTVLADTLAIVGGALVAVFYLDVAPDAFVQRLLGALELKDILTGLIKAISFAALIVLTGALSGLRSRGGADAVGRSTTQSVVAAIFAIIVADAVFSLLFYFGT